MYRIYVSAALYLGVLFSLASGQSCSEDKVRKCISIAEPMLKDPHLIFPDNMNDIHNVCRTWANFVDCIHRYIEKCFSKVRKDQFNSAVEPPLVSVHQMCEVSSYQSEYLQYAGCIKATVIEPEHCGAHYSALVNEVSQENVRKANLCCAYQNFRSCVVQKTRKRCDGNREDGIAARFSRQVLDKAFRFLQDQCLNYVGDTGKCLSIMSSTMSSSSSSGSEGMRGSTPMNSRVGEGRSVTLESGSNRGASARGKISLLDVYRAKPSDFHDSVTSPPSFHNNLDLVTSGAQSSLKSSSSSGSSKVNDEPPNVPPPRAEEGSRRKQPEAPAHYTPIVENDVPISTQTQRSSSYGRGISWSSSNSPTTPTTTSTTSEIPDWATNTWLTHGQELTTEEIYPAAGSFGGNNIDEPNQQGLSRNAATATIPLHFPSSSILTSLLLLLLLFTAILRN